MSTPRRPAGRTRGPQSSGDRTRLRRSASPTASRAFHDAGASSARSTSTRRWPRRARSPSASTSCSAPISKAAGRARRAYRMIGAGDEPSDRPDDQAAHRRRPRRPRRLAPRALSRTCPARPASTRTSIEDMKETARIAIENGFQLCDPRHRRPGQPRDARHLRGGLARPTPTRPTSAGGSSTPSTSIPADIPRFGKLGRHRGHAGHPLHLGRALGSQAPRGEAGAEGAYVWRKLMDSGATIANGTDAPVEAVDPIAGFYAAVTRKMKDGTAFFPGQKMTREEALRSYTDQRRLRRVRGGTQGLARAGQAGRHHGPLRGHHDLSRGRDPKNDGGYDHRRRSDPLSETLEPQPGRLLPHRGGSRLRQRAVLGRG